MSQENYSFAPSPRTLEDAVELDIGALVRMHDHDMPMVVEGFDRSPFGLIAQCCGFQSGNRLWIEDVPVAQVAEVTRPEVAPELYTGLFVRLRPAGPVMTVMELASKGAIRTAICEWDGESGIVRRRAFPVEGLILGLTESP